MSCTQQITLGLKEQKTIRTLILGTTQSFTLILKQLEYPINYLVALGYLVFRAADNIEDCEHSLDWKIDCFTRFKRLLHDSSATLTILKQFEQEEWLGLTAAEMKILTPHALDLWRSFHELPVELKSVLLNQVSSMIYGMERFADPDGDQFIKCDGLRIFYKESDLNSYCNAVAGTVGHFLTSCAIDFYSISSGDGRALTERANAFGRALHKVHIIKDYYCDLMRGICLFPYEWMRETGEYPCRAEGASPRWISKVVQSTTQDLGDAVDYLRYLPPTAHNYKIFCLSSIVSSYYFLKYALQCHHKLFVKSRVSLPWLFKFRAMMEVKSLASDQQVLDRYFHTFNQKIDTALATHGFRSLNTRERPVGSAMH